MLDPSVDAALVAVHADRHALVHRHRERLGAAHAADARRESDCASEGSVEPLLRDGAEGFICALQDALGTDVDP